MDDIINRAHCLGGCGAWVTERAPFCVPCRDHVINQYAEPAAKTAAYLYGVRYAREAAGDLGAGIVAGWRWATDRANPEREVSQAFVAGTLAGVRGRAA